MPKLRSVWSSWNYLASDAEAPLSVTYWMNRLQGVPEETPLFVTLNPAVPPREELDSSALCIRTSDLRSRGDQMRSVNSGRCRAERRTWFCGAYFGAGFHEDGLQAGLAVAEQLGGDRRPWKVENESGRIHLSPALQT